QRSRSASAPRLHSSEGAGLSSRVWAEAVLHGTRCRETLQQIHRKRHVAHQCRLVTQETVTRQFELQWLSGERVEPSGGVLPGRFAGAQRSSTRPKMRRAKHECNECDPG